MELLLYILNMQKHFTMATVLALSATQAYADKCYALAFGAGEQSSAYTAGVLKGLI
jgi:predicted acylesterase/phospholipase RssA